MVIIYNLDEYDKEPLWLLALAFIFGAVNLHLDVDILEYLYSLIQSENTFIRVGEEALSVGITEELLKFIVVMLIIYRIKILMSLLMVLYMLFLLVWDSQPLKMLLL